MGFYFVSSLAIVFISWSLVLFQGYLTEYTNVALGKPTMQSSTFNRDDGFGSHLVNDGSRKQYLTKSYHGVKGVCSHTFVPAQPREWWMVNLRAIYYVYKLLIYGRTDCCFYGKFEDFDIDFIAPNRSTDILTFNTVDQGHVTFTHYVRIAITSRTIQSFPDNTLVQFVRVQHRRTRILTICELEVYGELATCLKATDVSSHHVFRGRRYKGEAIETLSAYGLIQCMAICKNVQCCYAVNFNNMKRQCEIKKMTESGENGQITDNDWNVAFLY